jgi:hypothetical protein
MELKQVKNFEGHYELEFEDKEEDHLMKITVCFSEFWSLTSKKTDGKTFGESISFNIILPVSPFPYNGKEELFSFPIHMPNQYGRSLFKSCFDFFVKETDMPVHITSVDHPGYPLLILTFNGKIVKESLVRRVISTILKGIELATIEMEIIDKKKNIEDEEIINIDEAEIIDYEFDDELKDLIKQPVSKEIEDLPEREDSHD